MARATSTDLATRIGNTDTALTLGGVVVVSAGLSISSRFPATRGLTSLLWDSLDTDVVARSTLAVGLGRDDIEAKRLVGDTWTDVEQAWAAVASSPSARAKFQNQFAKLDAERSASVVIDRLRPTEFMAASKINRRSDQSGYSAHEADISACAKEALSYASGHS
jgi:hypothetical protein